LAQRETEIFDHRPTHMHAKQRSAGRSPSSPIAPIQRALRQQIIRLGQAHYYDNWSGDNALGDPPSLHA